MIEVLHVEKPGPACIALFLANGIKYTMSADGRISPEREYFSRVDEAGNLEKIGNDFGNKAATVAQAHAVIERYNRLLEPTT